MKVQNKKIERTYARTKNVLIEHKAFLESC